jgi:hypothetical protein
MAIITTAEYKTYAGLTDTSLDSFLAVAIPAAQSAIETLCGRPSGGFESATWTETWSGDENPCYSVQCFPITAITSVSSIDSYGTLTALDSTKYVIDPDSRAICRAGSKIGRYGMDTSGNFENYFQPNYIGFQPQFLNGIKNYSVTYTGGYTSGNMPAALKWAQYRLVDNMVSDRRRADLKSESIGDYTYTVSDVGAHGFVPAEIKELIQQWLVSVA